MAKARAADGQIALFRAATQYALDGQFFVDTAGRIRAWNPAAAGILGGAADQAAGQPIALFLSVGTADGNLADACLSADGGPAAARLSPGGGLTAARLSELANCRCPAIAHPRNQQSYPVELSIIALPGQGFHICAR